jgi:hypothetical protein
MRWGRRGRPGRVAGVALAAIVLAALLAGCGSTPGTSASQGQGPSEGTSKPASSAAEDPGWVRDTANLLDIWLPDANSDYYLGGFGTKDGARTVVSGRVPDARYWSFTMYPIPQGEPVEHIHDTQIAQQGGRYSVTIAASCANVHGTCVATSAAEPSGIVVLRLYVPVDLNARGTGGVPLPTLRYENAGGASISLLEATGTPAIGNVITSYQAQHGALPSDLTRHYPAPEPVPVAVTDPPPRGHVSRGVGKFDNPDNVYEHVKFSTTRGNLVVSARAPTYQSDSLPAANDLGRTAAEAPDVRYWSLCIVLKSLHTGDCVRDERVRFPPGGSTFRLIVSPTCPVAGYVNCLVAGPEPLQVSLAYRYLLPSTAFAPQAFQGPYGLTAEYVARPG